MAKPTCVELFAGAGGASVGLHRAGFHAILAVEWDREAHATLAAAGTAERAACGDVRDPELYEGLGPQERAVDLLWCSPPCQAWSSAGKRLGASDERNGWPWTFDVADRIKPTWVLAENVLGMLTHRDGCPCDGSSTEDVSGDQGTLGLFGGDDVEAVGSLPPPEDCPRCYLDRVIMPEFAKRYAHVSMRVINSADLGVPQRRMRLIVAAGPTPFAWPEATHTLAALNHAKRVSGDYWTHHGIPPEDRVSHAERGGAQYATVPSGRAWLTVHDAFAGIQNDPDDRSTLWVQPHQLARTVRFRGTNDVAMNRHMPSDTVTCRRAGSKTNDALIIEDGGNLRYLSVAEVAALQSFPADHPWQGSKSARYKQVGNAVPPPVAEALGRSVIAALTVAP